MLGIDYLWWLVPTRPELKINFYERVWDKKEVRRMYKENKFDQEEEESDPDKKLFAIEQTKAQYEKKVMWATMLVVALTWVFVLQDLLLEYCEWPQEAPPKPAKSRRR